jgi:hypothetical protein
MILTNNKKKNNALFAEQTLNTKNYIFFSLTELGLAIINLRSKRLSVVTWNGFPSQTQK